MYAVEFCKMAQISVLLCYQHATNISEFNVHPSQDTENNFCSGMHNANAHHNLSCIETPFSTAVKMSS